MSDLTYNALVPSTDKPLVWLHSEIKTPPFSAKGRIEAGMLLRRLQRGEKLSLPHSRPMPGIGRGCHELRIQDESGTWRVVYAFETEAIVILEVFPKKTQRTPQTVVASCKRRLVEYRNIIRDPR